MDALVAKSDELPQTPLAEAISGRMVDLGAAPI